MGQLERALEWLRPVILGSETWDYCVVWRHGDDPSRYIEWVGCCCRGGANQEVGSKKRMNVAICKDATFVHPASTKSCECLARLPPYMSVYSGIHGEVAISGKSRWLNIAETSDSKTSNEECSGTQVLIPVTGGLIEIFSTNFIPENESFIEYINAQFNNSEIETMSSSNMSCEAHPVDTLMLEKSTDSCLSASLNQLQILPWMVIGQSVMPIIHHCSDTTFDGSSTGSFPSSEQRPSPDSTPRSVSHCGPVEPLNFCHKDGIVKVEADDCQRADKKPCKSKNLLTERNRRKRINDGMLILRSVVPKITKMHKAATLSDASDYIVELENEIKALRDELDEYDYELNVVEPKDAVSMNNAQAQVTSSMSKCSKSEVEVVVNQIGAGSFLLRIACRHYPNDFTKLLEALHSLGVLVDDVNARVTDGTLVINFTVQINNKEMQEKDLRDTLMLLAVNAV